MPSTDKAEASTADSATSLPLLNEAETNAVPVTTDQPSAPKNSTEHKSFSYEGNVTPLPSLGESDKATVSKTWDHWLPFYAQRLIDQGVDLPNPYNIGYSYYYGQQRMQLSNLRVSFGNDPLRSADFVQFQQSKIHSSSNQIQIGAWVFPFLNVYGIFGNVQGNGNMDISFSSMADFEQFLGIRTGCAGHPNTERCRAPVKIPTIKADYHGITYGGGFTLVGHYGRLFFSLPVTYQVSDISMSDSNVKSLNIGPRVGWTFGLGSFGTLTAYAGGTYFDIDAKITGHFDIPDIEDPTRTRQLNFNIDENSARRWSGLAGLNWMPNKAFNLLLESGFGYNRTNIIVTVFYRF